MKYYRVIRWKHHSFPNENGIKKDFARWKNKASDINEKDDAKKEKKK